MDNISAISPEFLGGLRQSFAGTIISPEDTAYEAASTVFMRKGSPALILQCLHADDVAIAVRFARDAGLVLSVRSGGHSNAGLGTNDHGVVIDVSRMNDVTLLDEQAHRVRIEAGATWEHIGKALHEHQLAISAGDTTTVGASGLALGGGIGWIVREQGLAIDSLVSVDIVTADGQQLHADDTAHPDLFWAVRGGGGNFGVVTALEFIAHPMGDVYFGAITYPAQDPKALITGWRDAMRNAPEALTSSAVLLPSMAENAPRLFVITACWANDDEAAAQAALEPLRKLSGSPASDTVKRMAYYEVLQDAHLPKGMHSEVNNAFFPDLDDTLVAKIADAYSSHPYLFQLRYIKGALNRVLADATAFAHRDSEIMLLFPLFLPHGSTEEQIHAALEPWRDIAKTSTGGYVNFFSRATPTEVAAAYPPATYQRLAEIKRRYDPTNCFNQNLNIPPSA